MVGYGWCCPLRLPAIARWCYWLQNCPREKYGIFPGKAMDGLAYFEGYLKYAKQLRIADLLGWLYVCFYGVVAYI